MSVNDISTLPNNIIERRYSRLGKISQTGREDLLNNFRRFSKSKNENNNNGSESSLTTINCGSTVEFGTSLSEQLKLTSYQAFTLQQTWPKIKSTVFNNVIKQLMMRNTIAKEVFQKMSIVEGFSASKNCDQKEHIRLLSEIFNLSVQYLNNSSKLIQAKSIKFGEMYYELCGSNASNIWDDLGDCLTESIAKIDGIRGKREAFRSWISLISFLIDSMKAGYLAQCKRKSVTRCSNGQINQTQLAHNNTIQYASVESLTLSTGRGTPDHFQRSVITANGNYFVDRRKS